MMMVVEFDDYSHLGPLVFGVLDVPHFNLVVEDGSATVARGEAPL